MAITLDEECEERNVMRKVTDVNFMDSFMEMPLDGNISSQSCFAI